MEIFKEYMRVLVVVGMVTSMLGMLGGEGVFKKQIKSVLGIIVLIAVISPVSKLPEIIENIDIKTELAEESKTTAPFEFSEKITEQTNAVFEQQTGEYIQKLLNKRGIEGEVSVTAEKDDNGEATGIEKVRIKITGEYEPEEGVAEVEKIVIGTNGFSYGENKNKLALDLSEQLGIEAYKIGVED